MRLRVLLLFAVFSLGPVLASLGMSFTDMRRTDIRDPFAVNPDAVFSLDHVLPVYKEVLGGASRRVVFNP